MTPERCADLINPTLEGENLETPRWWATVENRRVTVFNDFFERGAHQACVDIDVLLPHWAPDTAVIDKVPRADRTMMLLDPSHRDLPWHRLLHEVSPSGERGTRVERP